MKTLLLAAASAAILAFGVAAPANAAVVVNPNGSVTVDTGAGNNDFSVSFDGFGGSPATTLSDLSATIDFTFTGTSNAGKTFNFDFDVTNSSSVVSVLSLFGFDVDPNVIPSTGNGGNTQSPGADSTGVFDVQVVGGSGTVPNFGAVDICFKTDGNLNNCASGQSGVSSVLPNNTASGTLMLNYTNAPGPITLSRFVVRYQGLVTTHPDTGASITSAIGRGTVGIVPEPATWAMMIGGFGLVGAATRRMRRTKVALA